MEAMNLENYPYMAVMALGPVQVALGAGGFMLISGLVLIFPN